MKDISTHHLFHRLWTKAVGTPDYDKNEWKELENRLLDLGRGSPQKATSEPLQGSPTEAELDARIDTALQNLVRVMTKKARGG